jgi:cytochrome c peroxidase
MRLLRKLVPTSVLLLLGYVGWQHVPAPLPSQWSERELRLLESLWLESLPELPPDTGNAVADNPLAAELGHQLFFDTRLSASGTVACATCHLPEFNFTDQLPLGVGLATGDRNTMGLPGAAYSPWLFWDGRKDSLWSQALEPLENPLEHASNRMQLAHLISQDKTYRELYETLFGALPALSDTTRFPSAASPLGSVELQSAWHAMRAEDQHAVSHVFANIGKTLAAYQRLLMPGPSRFDEYVALIMQDNSVRQPNVLGRDETAGLRLFINKAQCVDCHNGPLLTNNSFHNTAVLSAPGVLPALGRAAGLRIAQDDPFNCLGEFSDVEPDHCQELVFARGGDDMLGAQRTASLRNLGLSAPYMHAGQIATLRDVIEHYNKADIAVVGHNEAKPLRLRAIEKRQLEQFLSTLNGPLATEQKWLQPPVSAD